MSPKPLREKKIPVAVFLYNRPDHSKLALDSLSCCRRLDECYVSIYCDGPKGPDDSERVSSVRQVAHEWATCLEAQVIERDENLGLSRSIVESVSELCDSYGRVIVVEDDLLLSPSFLDYMLLALDRYADEPSVYQVSGYMFPIQHPSKPDAFFLPLTTTWGWATWARAWEIFDSDATGALDSLREPEVRRRFNLNNTYPYAEMLEGKLRGQNDSWGILFWWSVFKANGLVLHPRKSLVWNAGFDNSGTHCGNLSWSNDPISGINEDEWTSTNDFALPDEVTPDELALSKVARFLRSEQRTGNLIHRIGQRIFQKR